MVPSGNSDDRRVVLLATTTDWPFPARIAMAFAELGWHVEAVCWHGNPLTRTGAVRFTHHYAALRPVAALSRAIERSAADIVVPCDDRALMHLLMLHARSCASGGEVQAARAALIARSIGDPRQFAHAQSRAAFIDMARQDGIRAPLTLPVANAAELRRALHEVGLPAMLKLDRSWGGEGVAKVSTMAQAEQQFSRLSRRRLVFNGLRRLVAIGDPFELLPGITRQRPPLNVQSYVPGRPANCIVTCWEGRVLALIQVDVLFAMHAIGPATVVQFSNHSDIAEAARRVVARLGLSGFCGLDFVIDDASGEVHLIEMNQRATPIGHLALGAGRDPVGALAAQFEAVQFGVRNNSGSPARERRPSTACGTVALFPQAWQSDPGNPGLPDTYHDVPWTEPDLVRKLLQTRWIERSKFVRRIRQRRHARPTDDPAGRATFVPANLH